MQHDQHASDRVLVEKDPVFVRKYHQGYKWLSGVVTEKTGQVSFEVKLTTGQDQRHHQDKLRKRSVKSPILRHPRHMTLKIYLLQVSSLVHLLLALKR